jgi:hypothetical protein
LLGYLNLTWDEQEHLYKLFPFLQAASTWKEWHATLKAFFNKLQQTVHSFQNFVNILVVWWYHWIQLFARWNSWMSSGKPKSLGLMPSTVHEICANEEALQWGNYNHHCWQLWKAKVQTSPTTGDTGRTPAHQSMLHGILQRSLVKAQQVDMKHDQSFQPPQGVITKID